MRKYNVPGFVLLFFLLLSGLMNPLFAQDTNAFLTKKGYINDSLDNFKGEIKYYKFKDFPNLKYSKPKINKWVNNLEKINIIPENIKHIIVGSKNKQIKYIRLITDPSTYTKKFYTFFNDTLKIEISGLIVSAPNYSLYIYNNNLLVKDIQYFGCSSGQGRNLILGFCPYKNEVFEYYEGTDILRYVKTYYMNKFSENDKNYIIEYDKYGKQINKTIVD